MMGAETLAVVGLGYVGLPLAVAFGHKRRTIGLDLDETKLAQYRSGLDPSREVDAGALATATLLEYHSDPACLAEASVIIVAVPTPIDEARRPDLMPLDRATRLVGKHLRAGTTVIFESTVYPGCTEEVCVPILEQMSGLSWLGRRAATDAQRDDARVGRDEVCAGGRRGFYIGYSPERINPGDKEHRLETIIKVVSGDTPETLERVAALYELVVEAGVYRASSVKVAEAAKVIENTQRDLNIALMNELALIFNMLEIDTLDVLEAAGSKWNFLPFRPGLVGGHCIGVDPYYLTYKAESVGYHPQLVLGGRRVNDYMGKFIAEQTVKQLAARGFGSAGARVTVLGLTFKENCSDLRNSRVPDIIEELQHYCCEVHVHDPLASSEDAQAEHGLTLTPWEQLGTAQAVVLAVPHTSYLRQGLDLVRPILATNGVVMDIKGVLDRSQAAIEGVSLWRM